MLLSWQSGRRAHSGPCGHNTWQIPNDTSHSAYAEHVRNTNVMTSACLQSWP